MIFDNRIPIHQAHSCCHCESMSHISGCAIIRIAGSEKQSAITGGWLPPRRRPAIGLTILPSSHSPSVISGISTVKPSQAMGAVMREPREGEIPVEPTAIGRLMISQQKIGVSRTNRFSSKYYGQAAGRVRRNRECFISHQPQFCSAA